MTASVISISISRTDGQDPEYSNKAWQFNERCGALIICGRNTVYIVSKRTLDIKVQCGRSWYICANGLARISMFDVDFRATKGVSVRRWKYADYNCF